MIDFRYFRRGLATLALLAALAVLPACMLIPHHGHDAGAHTEQTAETHAGYGAEAVEPTSAEAATADKSPHDHGAMGMMHGSGRWGWLVGGAMVVMMLVVL